MRQHTRYLAIMLASFVGCAGLFVWLAISGLGASRGALTVDDMYRAKTRIADSLPSPKIVLVGGSSVAFGIQALVIEDELSLPAVNFGVHAGLQLAYTLHRARTVLSRGDTVVLALEYAMYSYNGAPNRLLAEYVSSFDRGFLSSRSLLAWPRYMLGVSLERRVQSLFGFAITDDKWPLGPRGDVTHNVQANRKPSYTRKIKNAGPILLTRESVAGSDAWDELERFIAWCRARGINVVAARQPVIERPEHRSDAFAGLNFAIDEFYRAHATPVLESLPDARFSEVDFFDGAAHLTNEGAARRSRHLARRLAAVLRRP